MTEERAEYDVKYENDLDPATRAANLAASAERLARLTAVCHTATTEDARWVGLRAGLRRALRAAKPPLNAPRAYGDGYADALRDVLEVLDALEALR